MILLPTVLHTTSHLASPFSAAANAIPNHLSVTPPTFTLSLTVSVTTDMDPYFDTPPRPRSPQLSNCSSLEDDLVCRTGAASRMPPTTMKTSFMTTSSSDRSTTDRAEHTSLGTYRVRGGPMRLMDVRSEAQLRFTTDLCSDSPSLDAPSMMILSKRYSLRRTFSKKDSAAIPRRERRESVEHSFPKRLESGGIAVRRHTLGIRRCSEGKNTDHHKFLLAPRRNSEIPAGSKVRGARSFFVKRATSRNLAEEEQEESARKLSRWTSTPVMDPADVEDARATFARCRNRGKVWGVASSPPPAPDALDAFTPTLARVADTRGLGRTLRALCATLPARTAFVHRDSLWRAADLAGNHRGAPEKRRKRTTSSTIEPCEVREIIALCPFGDALALASVAAAARGRVGVRRRVRLHNGRLQCSLMLRNAKAQVRVDVCEAATERVYINVTPATWPRRREISERLQAAFHAEWTALATHAPEICGTPTRHSASSRTFRRLSRR